MQANFIEIADDAVPVAAETQRIAIQVPDHGRPAHGDEALDHDGEDVLASDQAAIKKRQARRHEHDQAGAKNHETGVTGVEMKHKILQKKLCGSEWGRGFGGTETQLVL